MAQSGYTPILIYASGTAAALPSAANLTSSANGAELALNYADGKLYYKNSSGVVTLLASAAAASGTSPGGSTTQVQYNNAGAFAGSSNLTFDGTSLTLGGNPTLSAGTANGVLYLNGSKVATTGSAFTFDGTQLGIGISPSYPLHVVRDPSSGAIAAFRGTSTAANSRVIIAGNSSGDLVAASDTSGNGVIYSDSSKTLAFGTNGSATAQLLLNTSGNLGLGVTPSAWNSSLKGLQVQTTTVGANNGSWSLFGYNTYYGASTYNYVLSDYAVMYQQGSGQHRWYTAPSGTANTTTITNGVSYTIITSGNQTSFGAANNNVGTVFTATSSGTLSSGTVSQNITFTQAMTLDASGNLLVGGTSTAAKFAVANNTNDGTYNIRIYGVAGTSTTYLDSDAGNLWGSGLGEFQIQNGTATRPAMLSLGGSVNTDEGMGVINFFRSGNDDSYRARAQIAGVVQSTGTTGRHGGYLAFRTAADGQTDPAERARISAAGGFSVGTTADPGAGAIYATGAITAYYSDARLKDVKGTIINALDKVSSLSGVYYTNNEVAVAHGYTSAETQVGLLAQDVEAVLPEVVKAAPFDLDEKGNSKSGEHYKTIQYERVIPLLVEAIKELRAEVQALRS